MCQKKPGMRCRAHAPEQVERAQKRLDQHKASGVKDSTKFAFLAQQLRLAKIDSWAVENPEDSKDYRARRRELLEAVEEYKRGNTNNVPALPLSQPEVAILRQNIDHMTAVYSANALYHMHPEDTQSVAKSIAYSQWRLENADSSTSLYNVDDFTMEEVSTGHNYAHLWLNKDGEKIAFMKVQETDTELTLCDVEVREGHQGRGYSEAFLSYVHHKKNKPVYGTGSFTPEGFRALGHKLAVGPATGQMPRLNFDSMTFVEDWNAKTLHPGMT